MSLDAMKQALAALEAGDWYIGQLELLVYAADDTDTHRDRAKVQAAITALRAAIEQAQRNEFNPDWDAMAVMVEEQQRMATEIDRLKDVLNKSEARLHEIAVHCERVERRLKDVNTAAMKLTHDLVCMDYDDDDRLDRDRVMGRIMQWRNEWDKAMFEERNK